MSKLYDDLLVAVKSEYKDFEIIKKPESSFMKFLNVLLLIVTFGQAKSFMTEFVTTIGYKVYVPNDFESWPESNRYLIVVHESVHMKQRRNAFLGGFGFSFAYLLLPVPSLLAYCRLQYEIEAYATDAVFGHRVYNFSKEQRAKQAAEVLSNSSYFWTWWSDKEVESQLLEKIKEIENNSAKK